MKWLGAALLGWPFLVAWIALAGHDPRTGDWKWREAVFTSGIVALVAGSLIAGVFLLVGTE